MSIRPKILSRRKKFGRTGLHDSTAHFRHFRLEELRQDRPRRPAGGPPTISVNVPFSAAAAPPEMPASTKKAAFSLNRCARRWVDAADAVLISARIWPGRTWSSTPPSPSTTRSMTLLSGSDRSTISVFSITWRTDPAGVAPKRAAADSSLSYPSTGMPPATIQRVIRPPMFPSPMKPILAIDIFPFPTTLLIAAGGHPTRPWPLTRPWRPGSGSCSGPAANR